jgi:hypothetical protein
MMFQCVFKVADKKLAIMQPTLVATASNVSAYTGISVQKYLEIIFGPWVNVALIAIGISHAFSDRTIFSKFDQTDL